MKAYMQNGRAMCPDCGREMRGTVGSGSGHVGRVPCDGGYCDDGQSCRYYNGEEFCYTNESLADYCKQDGGTWNSGTSTCVPGTNYQPDCSNATKAEFCNPADQCYHPEFCGSTPGTGTTKTGTTKTGATTTGGNTTGGDTTTGNGLTPVKGDELDTAKKTNWWLYGGVAAAIVGGFALVRFVIPAVTANPSCKRNWRS